MDIMTKVRVLWEKVAGITADVSAVDAKATATAATLAGILPRIPADYSANEVNTGVKWIDGKNIYCKVYSGTIPALESAGNVVITNELLCDSFIYSHTQVNSSGVIWGDRFYVSYIKAANTLRFNSVPTTYSESDYTIIIYYTKPDPVPAQADNETKKRKTTKKEDK